MNREEYLGRLRLSLQDDGFEQVEEAIAYFNELLEDRMAEEGLDEESAVGALEAPELAARQLAEGYHRAGEQAATAAPGVSGEAGTAAPGIRTYNLAADSVRAIRIHDRDTRLEVVGEDRADIELSHPESERVRYDFSLADGLMTLRREDQGINLFFNWGGGPQRRVLLKVPRELAASLDLRTSNGALSLLNLRCWGDVEAATSNGKLTADKVLARGLSLATSNGALALSGLEAQKGISACTANGRVGAENLKAPEFIKLETTNGALRVLALDSQMVSLCTSNGRIEGTLPGASGDYHITSATSNGKNSLPRNADGGPKVLQAHTSNAAISLDFEGGKGKHGETAQAMEPDDAEGLDGAIERFTRQAERFAEQAGDKAERFAEQVGDKVERGVSGLMDKLEKKLDEWGS